MTWTEADEAYFKVQFTCLKGLRRTKKHASQTCKPSDHYIQPSLAQHHYFI
jgi:hypothetical protein